MHYISLKYTVKGSSVQIHLLRYLNVTVTSTCSLRVYLGAWVNIEIVIDIYVRSIVGECYYNIQALSEYMLFNER